MQQFGLRLLAAILVPATLLSGALPVKGTCRSSGCSSAAMHSRWMARALDPVPFLPVDYYGDRLTDPVSLAFYEALEVMASGYFSQGDSLEIRDPAVLAEARQYLHGDNALLCHFGAALDSFRYDHMEFFYVDWDLLSLSLCQAEGGDYFVKIGAGKTDSYLKADPAVLSEMKEEYCQQLGRLLWEVQKEISPDASVKDIAQQINHVIASHVTYSFCEEDPEQARYIDTAYGALINRKAICEGYARLYKELFCHLNQLLSRSMACELVSGFLFNGSLLEPHMWNYIQDESGSWFAIDPTMSDCCPKEITDCGCFWSTQEVFSFDHTEDPIVSTSQYEMPFPSLCSAAVPAAQPQQNAAADPSGSTTPAAPISDAPITPIMEESDENELQPASFDNTDSGTPAGQTQGNPLIPSGPILVRGKVPPHQVRKVKRTRFDENTSIHQWPTRPADPVPIPQKV